MLGADHHGYVARLMAMCAAFGDTPGENLELLIGQMVNLLRDGQPRADVEAGRHGRRAGRPGRRDRRGRFPLCVVAVLLGLTDRHRPRAVVAADQRQPGLLRPVRPRSAVVDPAQRRRPRAGRSMRPPSTRRCWPTNARAACLRALAEYPRVVARAAELREPHRVARYLEDTASTFHKFYDVCRVLPQGDEDPPTCTGRG
ncbi:MAG: DALR anticodon-binding domain-containing protein [Nocardioidaceae bacterium]